MPRNTRQRLRGQIPTNDTFLFEIFEFFKRRERSVDFPIVSLLPDFQREGRDEVTVILADDHYNETGHRIAGEAMARALIDNNLVPSSHP
ncbi:MAG: hypothetical protein M5R36_03355 [Deltaproteobacteria bacterium]|nr:hypothetical protein [Deltaproteobacteria bacterium]